MLNFLQNELDRLDQKIKSLQELLNDPQLKDLARAEIIQLQAQKQLLHASQTPAVSSPNQPKSSIKTNSVILEIRPGTGGDEAKLFALDLANLYLRFALNQKLEANRLDEGVIKIKGKNAYTLLQHEAGVHRVQRVPLTESQGRIHTSTATVAVLPEVLETEIKLNPKDIVVQFFHASSHGGQNVQKVSTAVRLTHKPTGIITTCQSQRFQDQNRKIATDLLRSKLYQLQQDKITSQIGAARQGAGTGMRSEKIRTYNFPQNRLTDHRLKKSWKSLDRIMAGDLIPVIKSFVDNPLANHP